MTVARKLSMRSEACDTIRREIHFCIKLFCASGYGLSQSLSFLDKMIAGSGNEIGNAPEEHRADLHKELQIGFKDGSQVILAVFIRVHLFCLANTKTDCV